MVFIDDTMELQSPLFFEYLSLFTALSNSEQSCSKAYMFLHQRTRTLTISTIYQIFSTIIELRNEFQIRLKEYERSLLYHRDFPTRDRMDNKYIGTLIHFQPQKMYPKPRRVLELPKMQRLNDTDTLMVKMCLQLMQALDKTEEMKEIICNPSDKINFLQRLFEMLQCSLEISLKAEIFNTISSLAQNNPSLAKKIWWQLEIQQVVPTLPPPCKQDEVPANFGIIKDLEDVEKSDQRYPLSVAFCNLINSLLYATDEPIDLGQNRRTPGINPYINFILKSIYLNIEERIFAREIERYKIITFTLSIFCKLVENFSPDSDPS